MTVNVVSFLFSWCWGPLCWVLAFFTASYQHLLWIPIQSAFPRTPSAGCGFPYHTSSTPTPTLQLSGSSNSTELYNRSTPTRSLKSNVYSSSSGNKCHAFQRSLSSGASLCSGTVGPSPCPILSAPIRPRDLFRLLAIGMCHFLPVHHLRIAFFGRVEGQNITCIRPYKLSSLDILKYTHTHTHTHTYIYIYIYIWQASSMYSLETLLPSIPIDHPRTAFSEYTKLMDLTFCLSADTGMSMGRISYENLSIKFILILLVVASITCSFFLNSLRDSHAFAVL